MNLSEGVVIRLEPLPEFSPLLFPVAAYAWLCARPGARSRPASLATKDVREALPACVCCQTQAWLATSSPFVENFVSSCFSLHSDFAELARCYAPVPAVSINTPVVYERFAGSSDFTLFPERAD